MRTGRFPLPTGPPALNASPSADRFAPLPWRAFAPAYAMAPFVMGYTDVFILLVGLYAEGLGFSPTEIGILVGARSALGLLFSIHAGTLMDRFGTRRITLIFATGTVLLTPLFPLLPWFWTLVLLQFVVGGLVTLIVGGGQTLIAQLGQGEPVYIGRWSAVARFGTTLGPVAVGVIWDFGGAWPAFLFATVWGLPLIACILRVPEPRHDGAPTRDGAQRFRLRDALPRPSDYARTFALMAMPAIAITVAVIFLRNGTGGMQASVYIVYLKEIGLTGTAIGVLFAAVEISHGLGALASGIAARWLSPQWTLVGTTALAIALIAVTPLFAGLFILLLLAQFARGLCQGVGQPMLFSIQSKAVGRDRQGSIVGLRQTMNRIAAITVPPLMGVIADRFGLGESFLILGGGLLIVCLVLAIAVARVPRLGGG